MVDEPVSLTHRLLADLQRQFDQLEFSVDRLSEDMRDLKLRLTNVDEGLVGVNRRLDRSDDRLGHIARWLDLVTTPAAILLRS